MIYALLLHFFYCSSSVLHVKRLTRRCLGPPVCCRHLEVVHLPPALKLPRKFLNFLIRGRLTVAAISFLTLLSGQVKFQAVLEGFEVFPEFVHIYNFTVSCVKKWHSKVFFNSTAKIQQKRIHSRKMKGFQKKLCHFSWFLYFCKMKITFHKINDYVIPLT